MGVLLDAFQEAVGSVKPWLRATTAVPLPVDWVILDGSVVVDPGSQFNGNTLPDLRGVFPAGHPTLTNLNFGADTFYKTGAGGAIPTGGVVSHNLQHAHVAGSHTHGLGSHSHGISNDGNHSHSGPSHNHSIGSAGNHTHNFTTSGPSATVTVQGGGGSPSLGTGTHTHTMGVMNIEGNHDHNGSTGSGGSGSTGSAGPHGHGGSTGSAAGTTTAATGNTNSTLGVIDNKPPFLGLVLILKIK